MPDQPADAPPETGRTLRKGVARWIGAPGSPRRVVAVFAAIAVLLGVVAASGIGQTSEAQPALDGGAWLGSSNGSLVHANGVSARIDWTTSVTGGSSRVIQRGTGGFIDQGNGHYLTIDGAGMKVGNSTQIEGNDVAIVSGGSHSFVVYQADGIVQEVKPTTLDAVGDAVDLGAPVNSAGVDAQGNLYAALNDRHQIAVVRDQRLDSLIGDGSDAGAQLVTVGTSVAAVDATAGVVLVLERGEAVRSVNLGLAPGTKLVLPSSQSGSTLWLTDATHRQLIGLSVDLDSSQTLDLPPTVKADVAPQPAGTEVYLFDQTTGTLATVDATTGSARTQKLVKPSANLEFFGKDGYVYVNDYNGPTAFVANDRGVVTALAKYVADKPLPKPANKAPAAKKLTPKVQHKPLRRLGRAPLIKARPKPVPKWKWKPFTWGTTTTTTRPSTTTTTNPDDTTTSSTSTTSTTIDPNSTTTTSSTSTTSTTTNPSSTTTTSTTTDPNSTTTSVPAGP